jgi:PTH1 family peptidyl-tRNA hydrolase
MSIQLVVGLGNPGRDYEHTRHNLGWVVVDALVRRRGLAWKREPRFDAEYVRGEVGGRPIHFTKPLSFMNDSGRPLQQLASFYKVPVTDIAVVYDDLTLPVGTCKVSVSGSAGGHNGVASVLSHLGNGFARYRLGIGPKQPAEMDLKDFVLGSFSLEHRTLLEQKLDPLVAGLVLLLEEGTERAMNQLNRRAQNESDQTQLPRDLHPR